MTKNLYKKRIQSIKIEVGEHSKSPAEAIARLEEITKQLYCRAVDSVKCLFAKKIDFLAVPKEMKKYFLDELNPMESISEFGPEITIFDHYDAPRHRVKSMLKIGDGFGFAYFDPLKGTYSCRTDYKVDAQERKLRRILCEVFDSLGYKRTR